MHGRKFLKYFMDNALQNQGFSREQQRNDSFISKSKKPPLHFIKAVVNNIHQHRIHF